MLSMLRWGTNTLGEYLGQGVNLPEPGSAEPVLKAGSLPQLFSSLSSGSGSGAPTVHMFHGTRVATGRLMPALEISESLGPSPPRDP